MALVVKDRVRETSTTTGTGTFTLAGAVTGFQTFSSAIGNTNTTYYTITNNTDWEVGLGTVGAGTLARTTILASSNANAAVNFTAGTKDVFVTYPADKAIYTDASNSLNVVANTSVDAVRITQTGAGNALLVEDSANPDSTPFVIGANGNVGIGTTSPSVKLEVTGATVIGAAASTSAALYLKSAINWNYSGLEITRNASNVAQPRFIGMSLDGDSLTSTTVGAYNAIWGLYDSAPTTGSTSAALNSRMLYGAYAGHIWSNNGTEVMRIDSSGNVGIGTASPNVKLDVIGSIEASPAATQDGIIIAGRAGGTSSYAATLTPTTLTASRTITIPDATTTMVGTDTTQTLTSKTLTNPTVTNYVESVVAIGTVTTSNTLSLTNGTVQTATLTASTACTFTMPTATAGKSFILLLKQAAATGNGTATFTSVKWTAAGAPTITATAGKMDILSFVSDGTNWYGSYTQGYTP